MLEVTQKSGRFIQALSFVQTLALEISSFKMSWEMIVLNFPRLVVLYWDGSDGGDFVEGNVDPATCNPPSIPTLRRLGGGYGYKTLYGLWECVQGLTHLDLTMVASDTWSTLGNRGLPLLSNLTHLLVCLEVLQKMDASERDIQVLLPLFPPSLLLCLVRGEDFHLWSTEEINSFSNLMYTLDDRLIVCMGTDSPMQNQWILKMKWGDEFTDWSGQRDERDTFWARGLSMVAERRTAISTSD
ncbi:hypothetical protein DL96DRAFT_1638389 [Flagelloscypha sp. PMI_526]|nr:hypothetical protein DL96DRAFT_1638389 [Flagelloscypha sp. PMI_526]